MATSKRAPIYEITNPLDAIDECYRRGWTDGLPVIPPTVERVTAMLDYMGLAPGQVLGEVPVRRRVLTAEQAAANAVMAGCIPECFPLVLATLDILSSSSPKHTPFLVREPMQPRSKMPGRCSKTLTRIRRTALPIVALARLVQVSRLSVQLRPISCRMGPFTIISKPVELVLTVRITCLDDVDILRVKCGVDRT